MGDSEALFRCLTHPEDTGAPKNKQGDLFRKTLPSASVQVQAGKLRQRHEGMEDREGMTRDVEENCAEWGPGSLLSRVW